MRVGSQRAPVRLPGCEVDLPLRFDKVSVFPGHKDRLLCALAFKTSPMEAPLETRSRPPTNGKAVSHAIAGTMFQM
eukprot:921060-Amphidinium_carterae.1